LGIVRSQVVAAWTSEKGPITRESLWCPITTGPDQDLETMGDVIGMSSVLPCVLFEVMMTATCDE
jgi:hypothetical protein